MRTSAICSRTTEATPSWKSKWASTATTCQVQHLSISPFLYTHTYINTWHIIYSFPPCLSCLPGLTSIPVDSIQAVFDLMAVADRNRSSTATNMNEHSSRSHMMLTVTVVSEFLPTKAQFRGKLNLVVSVLVHNTMQYRNFSVTRIWLVRSDWTSRGPLDRL